MLEFRTRKLKFSLDGADYEMNFPTVKQLTKYEQEYKEETGNYEPIFELLENCGLKKEVSEAMELDHMIQILQAITTGEEKK